MGTLMFRCPDTGRPVSTEISVSRAAFAAMPVFFSRTFCPFCRVSHEWFAKEAWVADHVVGEPHAEAHDVRDSGGRRVA
jgi:hypothetical protein